MVTETFPIIIGDEEVRGERLLTSATEPGLMMNGAESVRFIVVHCSATRADRDYTVAQLMRDHKARGFRTIGYHFYIRRDGTVTQHRRLLEVGAHCRPYNRCSIGVCYEGGLDAGGHPADTRTAEQRKRLFYLLRVLRQLFPKAQICGHRDMRGSVPKDCPCFNAMTEYMYI